jgi:hypothetical protein
MRKDGQTVWQGEFLVLDFRQFVRGLRVSRYAGECENRKQYEAKIAEGTFHRFSPWWGTSMMAQ